ncbi:hypothetical protein M8J76_005930 [Diaphorina citri]|nr:hypothetical protein M8J75_011125 [Diaphorina citri]KAI5749257.1 hypothetical protein M8J76_005930 [Diaphorina citri]KAI5756291.1 hypothetical protein M8J77_023798 [Diaphorina citri]
MSANGGMNPLLKEWGASFKAPTVYRVSNGTLRIQVQLMSLIAFAGLFALILCVYYSHSTYNHVPAGFGPYESNIYLKSLGKGLMYNNTYPLTPPVQTAQGIQYRIGIISDLDTNSKAPDNKSWLSYFKKGYLLWNPTFDQISIIWDSEKPTVLKSGYGLNGRGMELSELVVFDGKLLTVDDRTGIVYIVENNMVIPWVVLMDGNGQSPKGFKSEWATVKDETLYIGGMGKEWTSTTGEFLSYDPMWVKAVSNTGQVMHLNWTSNYMTLRRSLNIEFPGYMIHESGVWSEYHQRWFFLPRRSSHFKYDEVTDERMATNVLLSTDSNFTNVMVTYIGEVIPTHGYSSFKFLPGTKDRVIVALKSEEDKGRTATYITAFTLAGTILVPETKIADYKYEGLEFI